MLRLRKKETEEVETKEFELPTAADDLTMVQELALGRTIRKSITQIYLYLSDIHRWYDLFTTCLVLLTRRDPKFARYFLKGHVICSEAQRVYDSNLLVVIMRSKGVYHDSKADEGLCK